MNLLSRGYENYPGSCPLSKESKSKDGTVPMHSLNSHLFLILERKKNMEYNEQERLEKEATELINELKELQFKYAQNKESENLKQIIKEKRDRLFDVRVALQQSLSPSSKKR